MTQYLRSSRVGNLSPFWGSILPLQSYLEFPQVTGQHGSTTNNITNDNNNIDDDDNNMNSNNNEYI